MSVIEVFNAGPGTNIADTNKGTDADSIDMEIATIDAIANGKSRKEVGGVLSGKFPFRMREVDVLISHGYKFEIDNAAGVIHWIKP